MLINYRAISSVAASCCLALAIVAPCDAAGPGTAGLRGALTFHAGFDGKFDADFAKGSAKFHTAPSISRKDAKPGNGRGDVSLIEDGRFGGAIRFGDKAKQVVFFPAKGNLPFRRKNWSGTVSLWMRLDPAQDLKPGYADPIQITDKRWNNASFFLDFTKDDTPRHFRLGAFSDLKFWNPKNIKWDNIPAGKRPMVVVRKPPFTRTRWTHVLFTFSGFNVDGAAGKATLYVNGKSQGTLTRPQNYTWAPRNTAIMLGLSYIGDIDDLAIFNRALTSAEVQTLYQLKNGVADLSPKN